MKVRIFNAAISQGGKPAFDAFRQGVIASGDDCEYTNDLTEDCDIAVHASGVKGGRLKQSRLSEARHHLITRYPRARVVIESPVLRQGLHFDNGVARYWRIGLNGFLKDEADYANSNSDPGRWECIAEEQGIRLQGWNTTGDHVVIMLQKPTDASLRGCDMHQWCGSMIEQTKRYLPGAPIVVRPHPLDKEAQPDYTALGCVVSTAPIEEDLEGARAVITYTSLSAIESVCAGIPTWTMDKGSLCYDITNHSLHRLPDPWLAHEDDVEQLMYDLAYTQWTLAELKSGKPWMRLRDRWKQFYA